MHLMICAKQMEHSATRFGIGLIACLVVIASLALVPSHVSAQQNTTIAGDYTGMLGPLHIRLHLKQNGGGKVTATLDSIDRGALGIRCTDFHMDGDAVTFNVPAVQGAWTGTLSPDGTLSGTWIQGHSLPLNFARDASAPVEKTLTASR
jgi:hypothetical protein